MKSADKREILMNHRKGELAKLIRVYYEERGWNDSGIPTDDTLEKIGLWKFLDEATKAKISELKEASPSSAYLQPVEPSYQPETLSWEFFPQFLK